MMTNRSRPGTGETQGAMAPKSALECSGSRSADFIKASSHVLREQAGHMTAADLVNARKPLAPPSPSTHAPATSRTTAPGTVSMSVIIVAETTPAASSPHCAMAARTLKPAQATRYPPRKADAIDGTCGATAVRLRSTA